MGKVGDGFALDNDRLAFVKDCDNNDIPIGIPILDHDALHRIEEQFKNDFVEQRANQDDAKVVISDSFRPFQCQGDYPQFPKIYPQENEFIGKWTWSNDNVNGDGDVILLADGKTMHECGW